MAILYGTQSNGETLPVLVDQFGNLLAKGIEGEPGTPGAPGEPGEPGKDGADGAPGAPGGAFPLPPDPYEGAILGWLNNELAWIGSPPVPIPEGVFGPITNWDPAGLLTVEGDIPQQVAKGVHIYQCNEDGTIYVDGWNNSNIWSDGVADNDSSDPAVYGFNGDITNSTLAVSTTSTLKWTPPSTGYTKLELKCREDGINAQVGNATITVSGDGIETTVIPGPQISNVFVNIPLTGGSVGTLSLTGTINKVTAGICQVRLDGRILIDAGDYPTAPNLNFRIQSVSGQNLLGVANRTDNFTIGKYLRVPEQNVARWLYDGNLIKVITSTGIDISRLTGN